MGGYEVVCAAFCASGNAAAVEVEAKTTNCGLTVSSTNKGCIALAKPMFVSFNPHRGNTINWKAGCGKPARPVWREGRPDSTGLPYPYPILRQTSDAHNTAAKIASVPGSGTGTTSFNPEPTATALPSATTVANSTPNADKSLPT